MRRSELVALNVEDIEFIAKGALITIGRSKTDQEALGRRLRFRLAVLVIVRL
jgi:integrase